MHSLFSLSHFTVLLLLLVVSIHLPHVSSTSEGEAMYTMDPSELETLYNIMDTMSSEQNWRLSYPNPCQPGSSWIGIECKPNHNFSYFHVTRLDFGTPPNPTCKNTSIFPTQIFHLPYLHSIFFFQCFTHSNTTISFSFLPSHNLPPFSNSLQQLSLRSNPALTGPIPHQISSLNSLHILTLSQNHITGPVPPQISNLISLVHLDLSYNFLTGSLPIQLGNLIHLVGLDLSYNSLTGSIPYSLGKMGLLQKLDLSSNSLTGTIPNTITDLHSLVFMALSNNKLQGKFPKQLGKLKSLQYLLMDDNPMFTSLLPVEFGELQKLQEVRLVNSGFSGEIPGAICMLTNLTSLSLQNNRLTGEIQDCFGTMSHIYHLNLSRNRLEGIVPFNWSFLKRLGRNLDLSGNTELCLNASEAHSYEYAVTVGVDVCGTNKTRSNNNKIKPMRNKSKAPSIGLTSTFFLFNALGVYTLHHIFVSL